MLLSIDVAEVDKVSIGDGNYYEDKMVGRSPSKKLNRAIDYLTPDARQTFSQLRQAFTKALIFQHLDLGSYIRVETEVSSYAISEVLS